MKEPLSAKSTSALLTEAKSAQAAGNFKTASKLYSEVASQSDDKEAVVASADGLQGCGKASAAITVIENALNQWPNSPMVLMRAVIAYENIANHSGAARHLKTITQIFPNKARYWSRLGDAYTAGSNWKDAESAYAQTLKIAPLDPAATLGQGDALAQLGQFNEALECFHRLVRVLPDHPNALLKLGSLLSTLGKFEEAVGILRRAIINDPESTTAHICLGSALHYSGHTDEALAFCKKAMNLESQTGVARELVGIFLLDSGRVAEATEILTTIDRSDASIMGLIALYTVESLAENMEAAERALQCILVLDPNNSEARHLLASLHKEPLSKPVSGFVESVFSRLAHRFDQRMRTELAYQMPQLMADAIVRVRKKANPFRGCMDLGCGTGLMGSTLTGIIGDGEVVGIDISEAMLNFARNKAIYGQLLHGDVVEVLRMTEDSFDLITAADLLPYLGDLTDLFSVVAAHLIKGGVFAYTYESAESGTYNLGPSGRFNHSSVYLEKLAKDVGLEKISNEPVVLRYDKGEEVPGFISLLSTTT